MNELPSFSFMYIVPHIEFLVIYQICIILSPLEQSSADQSSLL